MENEINYFGTSLNDHGHYFWELSDNRMDKSKTWFSDIPFDPEQLIKNVDRGTVKYSKVGEYAICAIEGSCYDKRGGCHSVFWTKKPVELYELKEVILSIPIAKKIIEQMPFTVNW